MRIINVTSLRKNLFKLLDNVIDYNESLLVFAKKGSVIILSLDDFRDMEKSITNNYSQKDVNRIRRGENEDILTLKKYDPDEKW